MIETIGETSPIRNAMIVLLFLYPETLQKIICILKISLLLMYFLG